MSLETARLPRTAALLGGGSVGGVLLPALRSSGVRVVAAWSRTARSAQWRTGGLPRGLREAELVLLAVSDTAVEPLCAQLAAERLIGPGQLVVHLAGALDLAPLAAAREAGARTGSLHPLRTIPPGSRADALAGAACGVEGSDDEAREQLVLLAQALAMTPLVVRGDRALYHAAAVLAGGGQVALFAEAQRAFRAASGATEEEARTALLPLAKGALESLVGRSPGAALTGPVVRGDVDTVKSHLAALVALDWRAASLYQLLSLSSLRLSREAERLDAGAVAGLQAALGVDGDEASQPPQGLAPPGPALSFGAADAASIPAAHSHTHDGHDHRQTHAPAPAAKVPKLATKPAANSAQRGTAVVAKGPKATKPAKAAKAVSPKAPARAKVSAGRRAAAKPSAGHGKKRR